MLTRYRFTKNSRKEVSKMRNRILKVILALVMVASLSTYCYASGAKTINVTANIARLSGALSVNVAPVTYVQGGTDQWAPASPDNPIDFGTLNFNNQYKIFMAPRYYAVDIGIDDNSGANWVVTHTVQSVRSGGSNLDNNINVTFVKQRDSNNGDQLNYTSLASSNGYQVTKSQISGGWLRIYYGIATGNTTKPDAPGVQVIDTNKPSGNYSGSVTITVTP